VFKLKPVPEDLLFLSLILGAAVLMAWPLFSNSLLDAHDSIAYYSKAVAVHQSWREGDFLARWSPHINQGYGYPNLNFYSPLFFYIAASCMFFFPLVLGFHVAIFVCLFLSGVSMYFFARELWGRQGGLLSSVAYLFAPYHALDIYMRAAVGEATAFIFFPLILLAFYRLSRGVVLRDILIGVFGVAGLFLSHPLATFIFLPWAVGYGLFLWAAAGRFEVRKLMAMGFVFGGALWVTAYFVLPSMLEQPFVHIERFLNIDYRENFLRLGHVFYAPWKFRGASAREAIVPGEVHLLAVLVLLLFWRRIVLTVKGAGRQMLFFLALFILAIFFTLPVSAPCWRIIPKLAYVQFPWRFMMLAALSLSFLSGGVICLFSPRLRKVALFLGCILFICFNLSYCRVFYLKIHETRSTEAYVRTLKSHESGGFVPKWVENGRILSPAKKVQVTRGEAQVVEEGGSPLDRRFHVTAATLATLCFYSYYFPGWEVFVNGRATEIYPSNPFGLILFKVPPGDSSVRVHFGTTPVRQWGEILSLSSVLFLALIMIFRKRVDAWLAGGAPPM